jgi:hypothetical protein
MAVAVEARRYKDAEHLLNAAVAKTYQRYPHLEDEDISRTLSSRRCGRSSSGSTPGGGWAGCNFGSGVRGKG